MSDHYTIDGHAPRTLTEYAVLLDEAEWDVARIRRELHEARAKQNAIYTLYCQLRRDLEAMGPVPPIDRILRDHYARMQSCGYDDPLR